LASIHHVIVQEATRATLQRQRAIENAFAQVKEKERKRYALDEENMLRNAINYTAFRDAQLLMITRWRLPLNIVTWPEYQALLMAVNPAVEELLLHSGNTVVEDLDRAYTTHQKLIKQRLESTLSRIHFSMDVWSSPSRKAFIAIHAQWLDETYTLRKALLGLPNLRNSHAGEAMAPHIMHAIEVFNVGRRIGYFTGDNDSKNDTCLRAIARQLSVEYGIRFDPIRHRTRCGGHIINLSLQAFLFATSEQGLQAAIKQAMDEANDTSVAEALQEEFKSNTSQKGKGNKQKAKARGDSAGWRSIGAMGKLHNIAVFIRSSTIHGDVWDEISSKALGIDNITRWNSWFVLLDVAIQKEGAITSFLNRYHKELEDDFLTPGDWQVLKMTHEFLQPFWQATMSQQQGWASIDQVLSNMDILFKRFEDGKVSN